MRCKKEKPIVW